MSDPLAAPFSDLSVLVPTHGRAETLTQLLASLARQTLAPERFEVVVVDDGSPEPVVLDAARYPFRLVLLRQAQAGPGAARNRGLAQCRGPLTLILNDDAVAAPELCARHLAVHAGLPARRAVLGTFRFTARALRQPFVRLLQQSNLLFAFEALQHGRTYDWPFFWTCNLSLPTAALRAAGGFDAERFPAALVEDVELGYRLAQEGWRVVYREDCQAEHDHVLTPAAYLHRGVLLGQYLTRMWKKHGDPRIVWAASAEEAEAGLDSAVHTVELFRRAFGDLETALAKIDAKYLDRPLPPALLEPTKRMVHEVGKAAFRRGMHLEATGIDPLAVMEAGAPSGGLTSVVVVSYSALASTRRCIEALRAARDEAHPIELLVVDNGSSDGSAEWLAAQPDVRLVRNQANHGAPRARNQALARARGEWVAFLDNDVFVPRGWLARALYHGAVDPRVGAIPLVANRASKNQEVPYPGGDDPASIERAAERRAREFHRRGQDTRLFTSLAVLVRRSVLERIGGFDERFSPWGFEDDDLALRVRLAGWRNRVALDAFVFHAPYPDAAKHRRHTAWLQENWERFAAKWGPPGPAPRLFDYEALELDHARNRARELRVPLPARDAPPPKWRSAPVVESAPSSAGAPRNVVVLGSGRSGTSLLTGMLAQAGWYVGNEPYPGRPANPKGFFETAEINGVNEYLLAGALGAHAPLAPMQRWLAEAEGPLAFEVPAEIEARIRRLAARAPFAFKDPRFCYTLPAWRAALGAVRFVCVFRSPALTAASIVRECAEAEYLRGLGMDEARALRVWCAMYRQVLEQHRHVGEWLFVHYDQLFAPEGLARLEAFVGAPVARDFAEKGLSRAREGGLVPPDAARIYAELCALAGVPTPALVPAAPTAAPVDPPELSVLMCTYQRLATLQRSLASFERQSAAGNYEIVVVNDGSCDGTREWLEAWKPAVPARVVQRENGGLAAARNSGLAVARGHYVLFVNDDTIADEGLVAAHLEAQRAHAAAGGPGLAVLGSFAQPCAALDNALMRVLEDDTLVFCFAQLTPGERHDWNAFWTCNVSIAAEELRVAGGFDEAFRRYGCEDTDLAYRLHVQRGVEVLYEPRARAWHEHRLDFDALVRRNRQVARAWVRMFAKHPATLAHPYWRAHAAHTRTSLERELVQGLPSRAQLERSARELARLDLGALERSGPAGRRLAAAVARHLRTQLHALNRLWWCEGELDGLADLGADSIAALAARAPALPGPEAPWPLASRAPERLLAWPRYDRAEDLERLLETWAEAFLDHPERCLCLRHDPEQDGDLAAALEQLRAVYERVVGAEHAMEVLVVDDPIPERELSRLGRAVRAVLAVPGRSDPVRDSFGARLGAATFADPSALASGAK